MRASLAEIPPKHEKEIDALTKSYKDKYRNWLFELRFVLSSDSNKRGGAISISSLLVLNID